MFHSLRSALNQCAQLHDPISEQEVQGRQAQDQTRKRKFDSSAIREEAAQIEPVGIPVVPAAPNPPKAEAPRAPAPSTVLSDDDWEI
jgi:hypothetical protein